MGQFLKMQQYKIEVLTPGEELLQEYYLQTWQAVLNKIKELRKFDLDVKLHIFKIKNNDIIFLSDFTGINIPEYTEEESQQTKIKINKKPIIIIFTIIITVLLFPILILLEMIKSD